MERLAAARAGAERAQRVAAEAQLRLLQSQLEPHMLFNTLANLRVLIGTDAYLIDGMQRLLPTGNQRLVAAVVRRRRWRSGGQPA